MSCACCGTYIRILKYRERDSPDKPTARYGGHDFEQLICKQCADKETVWDEEWQCYARIPFDWPVKIIPQGGIFNLDGTPIQRHREEPVAKFPPVKKPDNNESTP